MDRRSGPLSLFARVAGRLTDRLLDRVRPTLRVPIWHAPEYRLPISSIEGQRGIEPRRADYVLWYLRDAGALHPDDLRAPVRADYEHLALVHTRPYLESLTTADTLARIFATDPSEIRVDEVLLTIRLACGATLAAAREALARRGPTLNLLGGFHHAGPDRGGGLCPLNDVAIAIAALRDEGFAGRICVIDLDAHPPDGTAACLANDDRAWIGSLSGSDWGKVPRADETVLPDRAGDAVYLQALDALLHRMPPPDLAFVIAGGDVLDGDIHGRVGLTLDGARRRDLGVFTQLAGLPSVWLPGGGYHPDAWKILAGTGLALTRGTRRPIARRYDPLSSRFAAIASGLPQSALGGDGDGFDMEEIEVALGLARPRRPRLLGYYTAEGLEYALFQYGVLDFLRRLGYDRFRVELAARGGGGDNFRLLARAPLDPPAARDTEHLLIELALERLRVDGADVLYIHWLSLRNPRARFSDARPRLPGQDVPGLGIAREIIELMARIASRLHLAGVGYRPAWFHTAWPARHRFRFLDPARQGRFEALARDLASVPLLDVSVAIAEGRVRMNGAPYQWEADAMILWIAAAPIDEATRDERVRDERERVRFTLLPPDAPRT